MFSLESYEVQFEMVLQVAAAKDHFHAFLKTIMSEEGFLYLRDVDTLAKEQNIEKHHELAKQIVHNYIRTGAKQEVNVASSTRAQLAEKIQTAQSDIFLPMNIFDTVTKIVFRELKEDAFARYARTDKFKKFLLSKGEDFVKQIALDLRVVGIRNAVLYQPKDFESPCITDKDIQFMFKLVETPSDWKNIYYANTNQAFVSRTYYSIGGMRGIQLTKWQGYLPCDLDRAFELVQSEAVKKQLDHQIRETLGKHMIVAGDNNDFPYSMVCYRYTLDIGPVLRRRVFDNLFMLGHDTERQCKFQINKTSTAYANVLPPSEKKKCIVSHGLLAHLFFKVSETRTRYVHVVYVNVELPDVGDIFYNVLVRDRAKLIHKVYLDALKSPIEKEEIQVKVFEDFQRKHIPTDDSVKTWEYQ